MCVVSNMGDIGGGMWPGVPSGIPWPLIPTDEDAKKKYADFMKSLKGGTPGILSGGSPTLDPALLPKPAPPVSFPTKDQFAAFDKLLRAAIEFDEATGQKECQTAAKTAWIKTMYEHFSLPCPL
jgi:hypothetical protein